MVPHPKPLKYRDCELFLAGRNQARLLVESGDFSGRPALDSGLERRLREAALEPERYGAMLFQALLPEGGDDLLTGYRESLAIARNKGQRLHFRLHISATAPPELHDLDWELLYDPRQKIALARSQETAFSRYLGGSFKQNEPVVKRPRLLVVLSCPNDLANYGLPAIHRVASREAIATALSALDELVTFEFLEPPATVERIRSRLVMGEIQALHLQAHGWLPPDRSMASLVLEADDQRAIFVDEDIFSEVFEGQRDLRLVSLIACQSGAVTGVDPFSGLGRALVRRGIPAVVAMRKRISLEAATRFSEHFYRSLAHNGRIDAAANEARLQLYLGNQEAPEWGTPALFMHLREGRLWETRERSVSDLQEAIETPLASRLEGADDGRAVEVQELHETARSQLEESRANEIKASRRLLSTAGAVLGFLLVCYVVSWVVGWIFGTLNSPKYDAAGAHSFLVGALEVDDSSPFDLRLSVTLGPEKLIYSHSEDSLRRVFSVSPEDLARGFPEERDFLLEVEQSENLGLRVVVAEIFVVAHLRSLMRVLAKICRGRLGCVPGSSRFKVIVAAGVGSGVLLFSRGYSHGYGFGSMDRREYNDHRFVGALEDESLWRPFADKIQSCKQSLLGDNCSRWIVWLDERRVAPGVGASKRRE